MGIFSKCAYPNSSYASLLPFTQKSMHFTASKILPRTVSERKKNYLINSFLKDIHSQQINNRVQKNLNKTDTVNLHGWKVNT